MRSLIVFCTFLGVSYCAGGMAELKSITGDAPYTGAGNAPAVLPQPMGFWGRPQYYGGFSGGMPMMGGGGWHPGMGWLNGDGGRFTSSSGGPYGTRGRLPSSPIDFPIQSSSMEGMERENLMLGALTVLGNLINPLAGGPIPRHRSPPPHLIPSIPSPSSPFIPSPSNPSLSSATGGGFYKGKGNDFSH